MIQSDWPKKSSLKYPNKSNNGPDLIILNLILTFNLLTMTQQRHHRMVSRTSSLQKIKKKFHSHSNLIYVMI